MDVWVPVVIGLIVAMAVLVWAWQRQVAGLRAQIVATDSAKRSQSTRYGQITEQFAPLVGDWPWDPKGFRFLGAPIDGVQFTPEGIVFVEIKTATSRLSPVQVQVRDHIANGRVHWYEHRIG